MAEGAIVFALANPDPEVDPAVARETAAVVATPLRLPHQINNVLVFRVSSRSAGRSVPHRQHGDDARAAGALADVVGEDEVNANYIIPSVFNDKVAGAVAGAVRAAAKAAAAPARPLRRLDHAVSLGRSGVRAGHPGRTRPCRTARRGSRRPNAPLGWAGSGPRRARHPLRTAREADGTSPRADSGAFRDLKGSGWLSRRRWGQDA